MGAFFKGAVELIKALPLFIAVGKEIIALLHQVADFVERRKKLSELRDAMQKANQTGDTSDVEAIFRGTPPSPK